MEKTRVLRFMSADEAAVLIAGHTLANSTDHHANGMATDSVGFCFSPVDDSEDAIYRVARHLSGIVNMQVCLDARIALDEHKNFKTGFGKYSDHDKGEQVQLRELSAVEYKLDDFIEYNFYTPDLSAGPFIYSESWRNPVHVKVET